MRSLTTTLLLLGGALAGCLGLGTLGAPDAPPPRACSDAEKHCDVSRGEICRRPDGSGSPTSGTGEELFDGICVLAGTGAKGHVYFEIQPTDASVPRTQFGPVSLAQGQNQELVVPRPVAVGGLVTYAGSPPQPVEGARVRFRGASLIPGRTLTFDAATSAEEGSTGRYTRLLPQGQYTVTVTPPEKSELRLPQERPLGEASTDITTDLDRLDLEISNPNSLISFSGVVLVRQQGQDLPMAGLEVWVMAFDIESLQPRAGKGRALAQPARTDADGRFTAWLPRLPADASPHRVRVEIGSADESTPFPTFRPSRSWELSASTELSEPIVLTRGDASLEPIAVSGSVVDSEGLPVPEARVTFRTDEGDGYVFATSVTADRDGRYTVQAFPGRYRVSALPNGHWELGVCTFRGGAFEVSRAAPPEIVVACEERRNLYGQVIDADAAPVPHVQVTAVRRPDELFPDELREETLSTFDGRFNLRLPPGVWDFSFLPPPDVAPFKVTQNVPVSDKHGESLLVFALDKPFELFGRLYTGETGKPLAGTIDAWVVREDGSTSLVGRGLSQSDGSYSIILPTFD